MKIQRKAVLAECEDQEEGRADEQPDLTPAEHEQRSANRLEGCQQMMQKMAETGDEPTCPMASMAESLASKARYALWLAVPGALLIGGGIAMLVRPQVLLWLMAGTSMVVGFVILAAAAAISRLASQLAEA